METIHGDIWKYNLGHRKMILWDFLTPKGWGQIVKLLRKLIKMVNVDITRSSPLSHTAIQRKGWQGRSRGT